MTTTKNSSHSLLFTVIRIAPLFAALGFVDLSQAPIERTTLYFDRFFRAGAVLLLWAMTEGVFMLWIREKNAGSKKTRGYGAATCLLGLITLLFLQAFRAQATQSQFLTVLAALALRGMSRGGWEQGRPHVSAITAPAAHALTALLSFLLILETISWQVAIIALTIGMFTGALETTWHASAFHGAFPSWLPPLYRISISLPPIAISSLSLIRQLPHSYTVCLATLLLSTRFTWNRGSSEGAIAEQRFLYLTGIYIIFLALVVGAYVFS